MVTTNTDEPTTVAANDFEKRFKKVIGQKSKALKVFIKAKQQLETADGNMRREVDNCIDRQKMLQEALNTEKQAQSFLENIRKANEQQIERMNSFVE